MTELETSPDEWIAATLPTKNICGVRVVYHRRSNHIRYYSVEWLAETFGEEIKIAENPQQRLIRECERRGYAELQDLFSDEAG